MRATIKDVSRVAGLSTATISKYMNGVPIKKENQLRIEAAMQQLQYVRNNSARGLRTDKSYTVGIVWDFPGNPYESNIIQKIEERFRQEQYAMMIFFHRGDIKRLEDIFRFLEEKRVDGIVIKSMSGAEKYIARMQQLGIDVVESDGADAFGKTDRVTTNITQGIYRAGEHLIGEGHKRIALLGMGKRGDFRRKDRKKGYTRVMEDYELDFLPAYLPEIGGSFAEGYSGMQTLWGLKERPSALILATYHVCLGAMAYLHDYQIAVPEELSLVVCDDLEFSLLSRPKLSALAKPIGDVTEKISSLLLRRMSGDRSDFPQNIKLTPTLVKRESVKKQLYREEKEEK